MKYVYIESEPNYYTVGFYEPNGDWMPESDFQTRKAAAERVMMLNGGSNVHMMAKIYAIYAEIEGMKAENKRREIQGMSPAYGEEHFLALSDKLKSLNQKS